MHVNNIIVVYSLLLTQYGQMSQIFQTDEYF